MAKIFKPGIGDRKEKRGTRNEDKGNHG